MQRLSKRIFFILIPSILISDQFCSAQWVHLGKLSLPAVSTSLVSIQNKIFAAADSGIFYSNDNGSHWAQVNTAPADCNLLFQKGDTLFTVSEKFTAATSYFAKIYRSIDLGVTWQMVYNKTPVKFGNVRYFTFIHDTIFAAGNSSNLNDLYIVFSADGGNSWKQFGTKLSGFMYTYLLTSLCECQNQFFVNGSGVIRYNPADSSWTQTLVPPPASFTISEGKKLVDWFVFGSDAPQVLLQSYNGGITWEADNYAGLPNLDPLVNEFQRHDSIFAIFQTDIYLSTDTGNNWTLISRLLTQPTGGYNGYLQAGGSYYAATSHGIFKSSDHFQTWAEVDYGMNLTYQSCFPLVVDGNRMTTVTGEIAELSTDKGKTWKNLVLPISVSSAFVHDSDVIVSGIKPITDSTSETQIYVSHDLGQTWKINNYNGIPVNDITWDQSNPNRVFGGLYNMHYVLVSNDRGDTWDSSAFCPFKILDIVQMGKTLFALCTVNAAGNDSSFKSYDGAKTWIFSCEHPAHVGYNIPMSGMGVAGHGGKISYTGYIGDGSSDFNGEWVWDTTTTIWQRSRLSPGDIYEYVTIHYLGKYKFFSNELYGSCYADSDSSFGKTFFNQTIPVNWIYQYADDGNHLYAATTEGIFADTTLNFSCSGVISITGSHTACNGDSDIVAIKDLCTGAGASIVSILPASYEILADNSVALMPDTTTKYSITCISNSIDTVSDTFTVFVARQCVWPGDANNDGIVNNKDVLALGLGYGMTGNTRPFASINYFGQYCMNWNDSIAMGDNDKFLDCDGNGTINYSDTIAILQNYSLMHPLLEKKFVNPLIPFQIHSISDTIYSNKIQASLLLGNLNFSLDSLYGLAFTISYDSAILDPNSISINTSNGLLGNDSKLISFHRSDSQQGAYILAFCRTNHKDTSGFGSIGEFNATSKLKRGESTQLILSISDPEIITSNNTIVHVNIINDTLTIIDTLTGINNIASPFSVQIIPNPFETYCTVNLPDLPIKTPYNFELFSSTGSKLVTINSIPENSFKFYRKNLSPGVYYYRIYSQSQLLKTGKLIID